METYETGETSAIAQGLEILASASSTLETVEAQAALGTASIGRAYAGDETARREVSSLISTSNGVRTCLASRILDVRHRLLALTGDPIAAEAVEQELATMSRRLNGECPSPLETLIIERILTGFVDVSVAGLLFTCHLKAGSTVAQLRFYQDWCDRAERKY